MYLATLFSQDNTIMATLGRAIAIAAQAHQEQKDKAGAPYILHPMRIMLRMHTEAEMIVAILHDVVEDTPWTLEALGAEGFSDDVLQAVACLTHHDRETYAAFIDRVKTNPLARKVKLADIEDNMDMRRLSQVTEADIQRMQKYHTFWHMLSALDTTPHGVPR
jgi:(p)ppGpp synthase/HD superfamily hydrolase